MIIPDTIISNFSSKLLAYIDKVESATRRQIKIEFVNPNDFGTYGESFGHRIDPTFLYVGIEQGTKTDDLRAERSIAHEITHGLLNYGLGYCTLNMKQTATDDEWRQLCALSVVDDIVVNKFIQDEGFSPIGNNYHLMIKKEIQAARYKDDSLWSNPSNGLFYNRRYMALRYILAWGMKQYCQIEPDLQGKIDEFLKLFQKAFPMPFAIASDIRDLIIKNDIFQASGHRIVIEKLVKEWNLQGCCTIETY